MKKTIASALPLLFAFCSLTTIACAAPTTLSSSQSSDAPNELAADDDGEQATGPSGEVTDKLAASFGGKPLKDNTVGGGDLGTTQSVTSTEILIGTSIVPVEVFSYDFGIENELTYGSSTTGIAAGKAKLRSLTIWVPSKAGTSSLTRALFVGETIDKIVLRQKVTDAKGKQSMKELALFETAAVANIATSLQNGSLDTISFEVGKLTMTYGEAVVTVSQIANTALCKAPCPCGAPSNAQLPRYVQADPNWKLPFGSVQIDSAVIAVKNDVTLGSQSGAATAGKASLEAIRLDAQLEQSGVCALFHTATGANVSSVRIDAATGLDAKTNDLVIDQTWDACGAAVESVMFSGSFGAASREAISMLSGGIVRTDWKANSKPQVAEAVVGWSFLKNLAITSCK